MNVIFEGDIYVHEVHKVRKFDEDDGWIEKEITAGHHECRILDVNGWKPHQIKENDEWLDVADHEDLVEDIDNARWAYEDYLYDQKYEDEHYCPSSTNGDYSPSNPWDAPRMSIRDFFGGIDYDIKTK